MANFYDNLTPEEQLEFKTLLVKSGSANKAESLAGMSELAQALTLPLREEVLSGDILDSLFESVVLGPGAPAEYPLHFLSPGTAKDFVAYTVPQHGQIPQRRIEGDYVIVPCFDVANSIDWLLNYARDARWDIVGAALDVLRFGFTKKFNDDAWHTILAAAVDRNILVFDADASAGQFTKRLVSLAKTVMRRNGGGNSTSINRGRLTDLYLSPEGQEDMRNWGIDQLDEISRREVYTAADGTLNRLFGVDLHDLDELGEGQEYQQFYVSQLAGTMPSGDVEIAIGLDRFKKAFVSPIRQEIQVFEDETLHRANLAGVYARGSRGWAVLDSRSCLVLSY